MRAAMNVSVILCVMLFLTPSPQAWGQYSQRRQGFWIGFGLGYGSANIACDGCKGGPRAGGATALLRAGGTLSPYIRLGGAIDGWSHSYNGDVETMLNVMASVSYYPRISSGFFVSGGLGSSTYRAALSPAVTGTGWGFALGVGYDLRVGRNASLTPVASYVSGTVDDVNVGNGGPPYATGWKQNFFDIGLGVTFH